ncbi:type II toxin-antitoxin system RelE/ParE family toxin [Candidatus Riflebacteria bacterium]
MKWYGKIKDRKTRAIIQRRIDSIEAGNIGNVSECGKGVHELKINYGPGFRIYFGNDGAKIIIILCGGEKGTQQKDINRAQEYWGVYKEGKDG